MTRTTRYASVLVLLTVVGLLALLLASSGRTAGVRSARPPDSSPASKPAVAAQTTAVAGGEIGVATYRNSDGRLCAAYGHVSADRRLVDRRGAGIPFSEGGDCTMRRNRIAVHVSSHIDDPTTRRDDRSVTVWGLAADDVERIEIIIDDQRRATTPGRDGAFIVSLPPTQGAVVLKLRRPDGDDETLTLPPAPDLDELNRQLNNAGSPRHAPDGP